MAKSKPKIVGTVELNAAGALICSAPGYDHVVTPTKAHGEEILAAQNKEPYRLPPPDGGYDNGLFAYRGKVIDWGEGWRSEEEIPQHEKAERALLIKHCVLREERRWQRIEREVRAFENLENINPARRERIPDDVRLFVWQRDEGKCVRCGSSEKLEFDHVIPVAKGGSNTARNVQLLCEDCNRSKGASIA